VRWSHSIGPFDVGLAHFSGTGREPRLLPDNGGAANDGRDEPALRPFYEQIDQTGLDLQATVGPWLWKLEGISRRGIDGRFQAAVGGFEYTFFDVRSSGIDVGLLSELSDDGRPEGSATLFVGSRLSFNDVQGTELLLGGAVDLEEDGLFLNLEGSRRLGTSWRLGVRARIFTDVAETSPLAPLREDDYIQLKISRFF
jgi:hypothetical protein